MTGGAQALAADADSAEPPFRDSARCLLRTERDGVPRLLSVSKRLAGLFEKQPESIIGQPAAEILGADVIVFDSAVRTCLATGEILEVDLPVTLPQGAIPSRLLLMPRTDGETVQLLLVDLRPPTPSQASAAEAGEDLLVRFRSDLTVLDCSESYAQFHGRRSADITGRSFSEWLPPAELEIVRRFVAESGDQCGVVNTNPIVKTQADGSQRWYRWVDIALPAASGDAPEFLSVGFNVTALKRARDELMRKNTALTAVAEELRAARIAAEESNRAKSRFLAHMSHELRTPLSGIIGFADIMRAGLFGPVQPERYREYVELIHNGGELLLSLINDVLDMSKIEAGKMELAIEPLEARPLAESCRTMVLGMARDGSVVIKIEIAPDLTEIHADARAAKQMIINLLSNAVKFTPAGGIVTLRFDKRADGVAVAVADSGIGMTPEELEKALQPFGQVDSEMARQRKGTGIGLTLVKSLAELHGGTLDIVSAKGHGTTATLTLPWMKPAAQ